MSAVTLANGKSFPADGGMSILDAALQAGVMIEHSCRTGRCGSCRSRVLSGATQVLRAETALGTEELASGTILTCARSATSDVVLDIEDLSGLEGIQARTLPCRIDSLARLADDMVQVVLRLPPGSSLRFRAGQYVDVIGPGGVARSYSIASDPASPDKLSLQIRQVSGGALSAYWFDSSKPGDLLRLRGPQGTFFLRDVANLDLVFLATGTGLAPILSMLAELSRLAADQQPRSTSLYWGGRRPADLYCDPLAIAGGLRYVPVLSRADADWAGRRGHVQDVLLHDSPDLATTSVYACGSEAMIQSARSVLVAAGLPERRFHSDAFVSSS